MKTAKQKGKPAQNSSSTDSDFSFLLDRKITKKNSSSQYGGRKARGPNKDLPSPSKAEELCPKLFDKGAASLEPLRGQHQNNIYPVQILDPRAKIKLRLFPIDEGTCKGLQKDGYYPYLELTLKACKKISSVLKHLHSKWGSSSIAVGELTLLPYYLPEGLCSCKRWTLNDIDMTAGDVYAATGNPAKFRLRYGWFLRNGTGNSKVSAALTAGSLQCKGASKGCSYTTENMHSIGEQTKMTYKQMGGMPYTAAPGQGSLQHEDVPKDCISDMEDIRNRGEQTELTLKDCKARNVTEAVNLAMTEQFSLGTPVASQTTESRLESDPAQQSGLWDDSFTNISSGGLFSEASLQGILNNFDSRSKKGKSVFQPSEIVSDSFDAIIAAQLRKLQGPRQSHESQSSILDAEDTCHAFSFHNGSSLNKDPPTSIGSSCPPPFDANTGSKSSRLSKVSQSNKQVAQSHEIVQESETDLLLCSRVYNDESSLGLTGINWTNSLGPFDLGLASSRKSINGDGISTDKIAG